MTKSYSEICKSAKYKLAGHGDRRIKYLLECLQSVDPSTEADMYGSGKVINEFESEVAKLLGKEKAVFFPSGTMAQQIAFRLWCDERSLKKVAYHPLCHLEIHEQDGPKILHKLEPVLLGEGDRLFTLEDLKSIDAPLSCVLIELPQREIGGQLPTFEDLTEISNYCKSRGIKLHLDGARLFEALPYYDKPANEICSLFDSVYVSFYKGLGGIAGAILSGGSDFIEKSKIWKRRHGGDLISLYPYIISAKYSMNKRMGNMKKYWQHALTAAEYFNKINGIRTVPRVPVCNMFHTYFNVPKETLENLFINIVNKYDLCFTANIKAVDEASCKAELSFGDSFSLIPEGLLDEAFRELESDFKASNQL